MTYNEILKLLENWFTPSSIRNLLGMTAKGLPRPRWKSADHSQGWVANGKSPTLQKEGRTVN